MKNFKKVLFGVLAMLVMVTGVSATLTTEQRTVHDEDELNTCLTATESGDCTLANDIEITKYAAIKMVAPTVTLKLGGHKLTGETSLSVGNNTVAAIENGTIELTNNHDIVVKGNLSMTSVTLITNSTQSLYVEGGTRDNITKVAPVVKLSNVTMTNAKGIGLNYISNTADVTLDNVNIRTVGVGLNVTADDPSITINGGSIVSVNANAILIPVSTTAKLTITSGKFANEPTTTNPDAVVVRSGEVNISGGEFESPRGYALSIDGTATGKVTGGTFTGVINAALNITTKGDLNVSGGKFVIDTKGAKVSENVVPAVRSTSGATKALTGGEYTATSTTYTNADGLTASGYNAITIGDVVYVGKLRQLDIVVDKENAKEIHVETPHTMLIGHEYKFADKDVEEFLKVVANEGYTVKYVLSYDGKEVEVTGDSFVMPEAEGKVTLKVSFVQASVNPDNQGDPVDPGTTGSDTDSKDETTDKNPGTFDGIASFVTLAVSSLGAAGYSIKKVIKR